MQFIAFIYKIKNILLLFIIIYYYNRSYLKCWRIVVGQWETCLVIKYNSEVKIQPFQIKLFLTLIICFVSTLNCNKPISFIFRSVACECCLLDQSSIEQQLYLRRCINIIQGLTHKTYPRSPAWLNINKVIQIINS